MNCLFWQKYKYRLIFFSYWKVYYCMTSKMFFSVFNFYFSCVNASVNVISRIVLIIMTAMLYQSFVLIEVFLNSYNLVYPPYLSKTVSKMHQIVSTIAMFTVKIAALHVGIFCWRNKQCKICLIVQAGSIAKNWRAVNYLFIIYRIKNKDIYLA